MAVQDQKIKCRVMFMWSDGLVLLWSCWNDSVEGLSDVTVGCDESTEDSEVSEPCVALITGPEGWCVLYNGRGLPQMALVIQSLYLAGSDIEKMKYSSIIAIGDYSSSCCKGDW